jgi:exodeoxyribonuclease VIII
MTEREYRQSEGISRSELWRLRESPEKFKWYQEHPEPATPNLLFGQVAHKVILEPDDFENQFEVVPTVDRRTKEGKRIWAEYDRKKLGKMPVSVEMYSKAQEMAKVLWNTPNVKQLLDGEHEKPFFWIDEITGEKCKMRADSHRILNGYPLCVDYKTAENAETEIFKRESLKYGYHVQTAMYLDGIAHNFMKTTLFDMLQSGEAPLWAFIVQEKDPPYSVNIIASDTPRNTEFIKFVKLGYDMGSCASKNVHDFRELIGTYHECKKTGNWYGYLGAYNVINNLSLPAWLAKEME